MLPWSVRDDVAVAGRFVAGAFGLAVGLMSLSIASGSPAYSFAGTAAGAVALLLAGWSLVAAGLVFWSARPGNYVGPLLVAAGVAWFLAEWDNPGVGSSGGVHDRPRALGVVPRARRHRGLRPPVWPDGGLAGTRWLLVALVTGTVILLGVLWAASSDPQAAGCGDCADNLVLVDADPGRAADLAEAGIRARLRRVGRRDRHHRVAAASIEPGEAAGRRARPCSPVPSTSSPWPGRSPRTATGAYIGSGPVERRLWFAQAVALVLLAAAVVWGRVRNQRTRQSLVDVVVELGKTSSTGGLRDALSMRLADPDLEVGYAIGDGRWATVQRRRRRAAGGWQRTGCRRRWSATASRWR